jgi:hypothetical protein
MTYHLFLPRFVHFKKAHIQEVHVKLPRCHIPRSGDFNFRAEFVETALLGSKCDYNGTLVVVRDDAALNLPCAQQAEYSNRHNGERAESSNRHNGERAESSNRHNVERQRAESSNRHNGERAESSNRCKGEHAEYSNRCNGEQAECLRGLKSLGVWVLQYMRDFIACRVTTERNNNLGSHCEEVENAVDVKELEKNLFNNIVSALENQVCDNLP